MDSDTVKSTLSNLAFGNVLAAAARDYKKEVLANEKAQASNPANEEVDFDELMDDPELEKLHADRIAALKREVEKREVFKRQGHGEYREVSEGDFLGEVTRSEKVIGAYQCLLIEARCIPYWILDKIHEKRFEDKKRENRELIYGFKVHITHAHLRKLKKNDNTLIFHSHINHKHIAKTLGHKSTHTTSICDRVTNPPYFFYLYAYAFQA